MPNCHEMKRGEIYVCEDCGLGLQVVKECKHAWVPAEKCGCHPTAGPCTFNCCGKDLVKK